MSDVTPLIEERQQICRSHNTTDLEIKCQTSCRSSTREIKFTANLRKNTIQLISKSNVRRHLIHRSRHRIVQVSVGAEASVSESRSQCHTRPRGPTACLAPINLLRGHAITEKMSHVPKNKESIHTVVFPKNNRHLQLSGGDVRNASRDIVRDPLQESRK